MTGATLEFDSRVAVDVLDNPQALFRDMGEYPIRSTERRFGSQTAPDGTPWAPLSPRYKKTEKEKQEQNINSRRLSQNSVGNASQRS